MTLFTRLGILLRLLRGAADNPVVRMAAPWRQSAAVRWAFALCLIVAVLPHGLALIVELAWADHEIPGNWGQALVVVRAACQVALVGSPLWLPPVMNAFLLDLREMGSLRELELTRLGREEITFGAAFWSVAVAVAMLVGIVFGGVDTSIDGRTLGGPTMLACLLPLVALHARTMLTRESVAHGHIMTVVRSVTFCLSVLLGAVTLWIVARPLMYSLNNVWPGTGWILRPDQLASAIAIAATVPAVLFALPNLVAGFYRREDPETWLRQDWLPGARASVRDGDERRGFQQARLRPRLLAIGVAALVPSVLLATQPIEWAAGYARLGFLAASTLIAAGVLEVLRQREEGAARRSVVEFLASRTPDAAILLAAFLSLATFWIADAHEQLSLPGRMVLVMALPDPALVALLLFATMGPAILVAKALAARVRQPEQVLVALLLLLALLTICMIYLLRKIDLLQVDGVPQYRSDYVALASHETTMLPPRLVYFFSMLPLFPLILVLMAPVILQRLHDRFLERAEVTR